MQFATPDDAAAIHRRIITGLSWKVGSVELDSVTLSNGMSEGRLRFFEAQTPVVLKPALLQSFLRLRPKNNHPNDRQILQFSRRWGALSLCRHGVPLALCRATPPCREWQQFRAGAHPHVEHTDDWRRWADCFAALVRLHRQLDKAPHENWDRETVRQAFDWLLRSVDTLAPPANLMLKDARTDEVLAQPPWFPPTVDVRRTYLQLAFNGLLWAANVGRRVVTTRGQWALIDGASSLFSGLVLQLVQRCVRVSSLAICHECGDGFKADRRTAKYCQKCRDRGVPEKWAMQARRDRLRACGRTSRNKRPRARRQIS